MTYNVLLADPPWHYATRGKSNHKTHYDRMTLTDIAALPVEEQAADNAALFFWVVDWLKPSDQEKIANAWGFEYRTRAWTWIKANKSGMGFFWGRGFYTRSNPEDCWLCVRGKMPVDSHSVLSVIYSPIQKHSRKPDEQYDKIETLYPNSKYLELFARQRRPGWHAWGNQVPDGNDIELSIK